MANNVRLFFQKNLIAIDETTGIKSGCLYNSIVYRRRKRRRTERSIINDSLTELTDEQKNGVLNFLKTCRLPAQKSELQTILSQYKVYRMDLIRTSFDEYKAVWNFYFACIEFVS